MKRFLTLLVGLVATSVCYSAPTYTAYFNNVHVYTNITLGGVTRNTWPSSGVSGTVINTGASTVGAVPVYTDLTGTNVAPTSVTISGADLTAGVLQSTKAFRSYQGSLTHAGTVTLDFDATTTVNSISLTGNVTFAFSNLATNRTCRLRVVNPQATNITLTFPAGVNTSTNWIGGKPGSMAAGTVALWSLEAWGATDGDVLSAWGDAF